MSERTTRGDGVIVDRPPAGTGTLTRPASASRQGEAPARQGRGRADREQARPAGGRVPRQRAERQRTEQDRPGQDRPGRQRTAPRRRPAAAVAPPRQASAPAADAVPAGLRGDSPAAANRMPFIVLLCGLLGGALVSALVISTTLADGSFEISKLQQSQDALARQRQTLQDEVAQAQSAPVIEQRAYQLGMRPVGQLRFVNLKTGKIETDAGSGGVAAINVPGYTP